MRYLMSALVTLTVVVATPAMAAKVKPVSMTPSFDDCYRLGWVRGMHVEQNELPAWAAECMAGRIPFNSGLAADSIRRIK